MGSDGAKELRERVSTRTRRLKQAGARQPEGESTLIVDIYQEFHFVFVAFDFDFVAPDF
jgi:hypothetical protein